MIAIRSDTERRLSRWLPLALLMGAVVVPATTAAQRPIVPIVAAAASADSAQAGTAHSLAIFSASARAMRDSLVALARAQLGRRYVYGGSSPERGFDCSGLLRYISNALHLELPRTAAQQAKAGVKVARDTTRLLPGDILTFGRGRVSHVGIYIGNGRFIHASSAAGKVIESELDRPPAPRIKPWRGVRRLVTDSTLAADHSG
ncbi:MAG TPA: C40 family peptidase [Gemmatimonadaceae bacterium]|nr:C40 family peptidase [Gemmatimonadaceae bacterium]